MTDQRVSLALIGCGSIAQSHWQGIQGDAPNVHVTAVIDTDSERAQAMAKQTGAQAFTSINEALDKGSFDAVDIMLPHDQHEEAAITCFDAGKHVVLEKPMAMTLDACQRIMDAAASAGTVFMVAEQSHYWPDAVKIQQMIDEGAIGEVITARAFFGGSVDSGWESKPWRYELAKAGGGITIDGGAHWIRPLRMWLGEIDEVVAVTGRPLADMEGESLARALLRFQSGIVAVFDALHAGSFMGPSEEFRVTGTEGELLVEKGHEGRVMLYTKEHSNGHVLLQKDEGRSASFGYELQDFALAVLEGKALEAGPEYSLGELRTALAIYRSAETRQWEKVWD